MDPRVAGICDERGASAVAVPAAQPVGDDRIDAVPGAGGDFDEAVSVGPGHREPPAAGGVPALADHAVLDGAVVVPPASSELAVFSPPGGGPRSGVGRGIEHPPR